MSRLSWADLLIEDISPEQFSEWITPWSGVVHGVAAPAFVSKFGFWFLRRPEGHVEILDAYNGTLGRIADSYDEFMRDVNEQWWQEVYLMSKLVLQLHDAGKIPGPGQCYAIPHPAIGGPNPASGDAVDPRFVTVMDVSVWQSLCAQFLGVTPRD